MCRVQLIREISVRTGVRTATVEAILDAFQDVTAESLAKGDKVLLTNFGVFEIKSRNPRIGRNPHTGEDVDIPARVLPSFTPSDALKDRISGRYLIEKSAKKSPRISPAK